MSVTLILIILNTIISLIALYSSEKVFYSWMLKPYRMVRERTWYELITSGFIHAGWGHLIINMFVLYVFGSVVEQYLGAGHFLTLYMTGLLFSSLPSAYMHKNNPQFATIGASGAVEAVLFSFIFAFPTEKLILILFPIPIPAWLFGLLFLAYSVYESKRGKGNVNHTAHLAGAFWGILYMLLFVPGGVDHALSVFGLN